MPAVNLLLGKRRLRATTLSLKTPNCKRNTEESISSSCGVFLAPAAERNRLSEALIAD
jgi:hypothetical protein